MAESSSVAWIAPKEMDGYLLTVSHYGDPMPQGSKTLMPNGQMVESANLRIDPRHAQTLEKFRTGLAWKTKAEVNKLPERIRRQFPLAGPLVACMVFTMRRVTKSDRADAPVQRPDVSKLARATEDAITGVAYLDDAQIIGYDIGPWKTYPGRHPLALHRPGVTLAVRRATHEEIGLDPDSLQGRKYTQMLRGWAGD